MWSEARLVRRRRNHELANEVSLQYSAMAAVLGGNKKFNKQIEKLENAD